MKSVALAFLGMYLIVVAVSTGNDLKLIAGWIVITCSYVVRICEILESRKGK